MVVELCLLFTYLIVMYCFMVSQLFFRGDRVILKANPLLLVTPSVNDRENCIASPRVSSSGSSNARLVRYVSTQSPMARRTIPPYHNWKVLPIQLLPIKSTVRECFNGQ